MAGNFKPGDYVGCNSDAGRVRGTIQKKVTGEIVFKGYKQAGSVLPCSLPAACLKLARLLPGCRKY